MRRFDKLKNIREKNKSIQQEYLLETSSLTSKSYKNQLLIESIISTNDEEYLFYRFILEGCNEEGINISQIIIENNINISHKKDIHEAGLGLGLAVALSGGKAMQLIGVAIKKLINYLKRKGIMKGGQIVKKNILEKWGEKWQNKIIMGFFRGVSKMILIPISEIVGAVSLFINPSSTAKGQKEMRNNSQQLTEKISSEEAIESLASALFYGAVVILGVQGGVELWEFFTGGGEHGIFTPAVEILTSGAKLYEVILLLLAIFLSNYVDSYKKYDSKKLAHGVGECLENPGGVRKLLSSIKNVVSSKEKSANFSECIANSMGGH